ncbi:myeloperoxidase [Dulcicalothrix desertica PCC 7102]|uniref:Myeloperoxidase n=1 Tax=Dulcicalothrix desertica PCC 7102 TaxID=232991 RepID=A0A433VGC8_9CYAN|nr:heme peroxidase family protein [Dulcicalothrix desertica]RUT05142.1 myeloperoxidase [Dulcicalothrix desertica PCC 7102]TWH43350.1 heme peroxidase [Dulcicalothrix desertica PCC 7102]
MARGHGFSARNGENQPLGEFTQTGKFGRLFPRLPAFTPSVEKLTELGNAMIDPNPELPEGDNNQVPAGYTYLGQFIDHDITLDTSSLQEVLVDPLAVRNFRTPMLDLDSIYGSGPLAQPYLYRLDDPSLFLIGETSQGGGDPSIPPGFPNDLPRVKSGLAILGDSRNDENLIVAQLHLAFLKFHNKVVAGLRDGSIKALHSIDKPIFEQARELVIWHYQWIVLFDFLARVIDKDQLESVLKNGRRFFKFKEQPFIPVEFSVAAFRLGHSMIRAVYDYNRVFTPLPGGVVPATLDLLFTFTAKSNRDGAINVPVPSDWIIDWRRFFDIDSNVATNPSRKLDTSLVDPLKNIPNIPAPTSLSVRNLLRGRSMGLPSGQSVARFMRFKPLSPAEIAQGKDGAVAAKHNLHVESPLWYYILKEAQVQGKGLRLGQVGSRILAEVFVGLLEADSSSFIARNPEWKPTLPAKVHGTFSMADMLKFVDDVNPIG